MSGIYSRSGIKRQIFKQLNRIFHATGHLICYNFPHIKAILLFFAPLSARHFYYVFMEIKGKLCLNENNYITLYFNTQLLNVLKISQDTSNNQNMDPDPPLFLT